MSAYVVGHVLRHNRSARGVARCVLVVLADHAHSDGTNSYPSLSTIAQEACCNRSYVPEALQQLEQVGAIVRTGTGRRGVTVWTVVMAPSPDAAAPAPDEADWSGEPTSDQSGEPTAFPPDQSGQTTSRVRRPVGSTGATGRVSRPEPTTEPTSTSPPAPKGEKPDDDDPGELLPPTPPSGSRKRDIERYERELAAFMHRVAEGGDSERLDELWRRMLDALRQHVDPDTVEMWLGRCGLASAGGDRLVLVTPHDVTGWVRDRFARRLAAIATELVGHPVSLDVIPASSTTPPVGAQDADAA